MNRQEQQTIDMKWMLKFYGYKTEDNLKFTKVVGKNIARSVTFLEDFKVAIKYLNKETKFTFSETMLIEDGFNWIA